MCRLEVHGCIFWLTRKFWENDDLFIAFLIGKNFLSNFSFYFLMSIDLVKVFELIIRLIYFL